jgi:hypothetical protein
MQERNAKSRISAPIVSTATKAVYSHNSKTPNFSILDLQGTPMSSNTSFVSHSTSQIENKRNSNSLSHKSETSSKNLKIIPQRNSIIENEKGNSRSILVQDESELQVILH